jgi:E3 ubiquitin-protein ligase HERC2
MDLVILQLIKQNNSIQQKELPENIRHLLFVMNVINVLTDQTKEKSIPDEFFSGERKKLTREDFDKCNHYFNNTIDQQLIRFINTSPSNEDSFENFIENLPNEYEKYFSLSNIPIDCIKIRCEFLYQLNTFIVQILPMIDLNLSSGESFLTDQIRLIKPYLFHQTKFELLDLSLEKTTIKYHIETLRVSFNLIKSSENNTNSENTMFYQAYHQLSSIAHIHFRKKVKQLWQAIYVGMHSIDQGGPYRDSITQICSDICSTRLSLFILCPNGRTNTGLNKDCWIPNVFPPNKIIPDEMKKQYQFIGQLMGMAIRKKHYLDFKFPLLFWKQLLKESITIEAIDLQSFTIINELEKYIEQTISNDDINDIFSSIISELYFEVVSSNGQTYELIPDGMNIQITSLNFKQYSICYRQYRLNEFQRQIEFIRQGLCSVVPFYFLSLFTPNELEEAVCGKGQIDIELLKRNTQYNDGEEDQDKPHIQRFWTVIGQMFNEEQKKLFLTFVWGRNTLPSRDQDFTMKFTINQYSIDDGDVDKALPRSHTCAFALDLPEYSTTEIMYERLNYAITYCSSIDGDGTFNDETNTRNLLEDSDSDD